MEIIKNKLSEIKSLCVKYHVAQLFIFGSFAKGNFNAESDIDFLVYFTDDIALLDYADNFFDFIYELEKLFNRKIDMVSGKAMKNPYFIQEVEKTKKLIYDKLNKKIAV
jgi:predicted nucleotidyltransferase